ncbi:glycoside hydrolase domain-containing protein [Mucilaginibacter sp.]|jgi:putative alpha-1,2-mannosidase|uniref:glycoside hydrolase domain-containing protein n=1 Tax=Mucilaginibacter sp. TaxID=1882438 RepID=UPI003564C8CF
MNLSGKFILVESVTLNGKPYYKPYITHQELMSGGTITFIMGSKPVSAKTSTSY